MPDPQIFDDLNFNFSTLSQRLREMAFLNRGLRISLTDEREETDEVSALGVEDEGDEASQGSGRTRRPRPPRRPQQLPPPR